MIARRIARPVIGLALAGVLAAVCAFAIHGYFTPEAMMYFLSFRWCS